jgi:hypothetical protein
MNLMPCKGQYKNIKWANFQPLSVNQSNPFGLTINFLTFFYFCYYILPFADLIMSIPVTFDC